MVICLAGLLLISNLQRFQVTGWPPIYISDLGFGWLTVFWLWLDRRDVLRACQRLITTPLLRVVIGWVLLGWLGAIWQNRFSLEAVAYATRLICFGYVTWALPSKTKWSTHEIFSGYLGILLGLAAFGWLQWLLLPDLRFLRILGWDDHYQRMVGTLLDPGFFGLSAVIATLAWDQAVSRKTNLFRWGVGYVMLVITIFLSYSRAAYLAFLIMIGWKNFRTTTNRTKVVSLCLIGLVASVIFWGNRNNIEGTNLLRTESIQARIRTQREVLHRSTAATFLIGNGLFIPSASVTTSGKLPMPNTARFADSSLVWLITSLGIPGTLGVAWLLWHYRVQIFTKKTHQELFIVVAVFSLFNHVLTHATLLPLIIGYWLYAPEKSETK